MVGQEIRHSHFLAFLLDPSQNHGLRDGFLKRFLSMVIRANPDKNPLIPLIDTDGGDFDDAEVAREQDNIDIRIVVPSKRLVVVVENKIYSGEHSDQLARYWKIAENRYAGWKILPIYLTLTGDEPSDDRYLTATYGQVATLVDDTANRAESTIGREVHALLKHYVVMLRRHHLADTELDELCARIYQRHKRAIDLIIEKRPDRTEAITGLIRSIIEESSDMVLNHSKNGCTSFGLREWLSPAVLSNSPYREDDYSMLFFFNVEGNRVYVKMQIVPIYDNVLRQRIWDFACAAGSPFKISVKSRITKWATIYSKTLLEGNEHIDLDMDEIEVELRRAWSTFLITDLPKIRAAINAEFGIIIADEQSHALQI
jgi:hypothetical protein